MSEVELLKIFGGNLQSLLEEVGISQNQLAEESGLNKSSISRYVNGTQMPTIKALINIAYCLECDLDDLIPTYDLIE